jgi:hypothetical protein
LNVILTALAIGGTGVFAQDKPGLAKSIKVKPGDVVCTTQPWTSPFLSQGQRLVDVAREWRDQGRECAMGYPYTKDTNFKCVRFVRSDGSDDFTLGFIQPRLKVDLIVPFDNLHTAANDIHKLCRVLFKIQGTNPNGQPVVREEVRVAGYKNALLLRDKTGVEYWGWVYLQGGNDPKVKVTMALGNGKGESGSLTFDVPTKIYVTRPKVDNSAPNGRVYIQPALDRAPTFDEMILVDKVS